MVDANVFLADSNEVGPMFENMHFGCAPSPGEALSVGWELVSAWRNWPCDSQSSGHEALPLGQGGRAAITVGLAINEMALRVEMVVQAGVDGSKFL